MKLSEFSLSEKLLLSKGHNEVKIHSEEWKKIFASYRADEWLI